MVVTRSTDCPWTAARAPPPARVGECSAAGKTADGLHIVAGVPSSRAIAAASSSSSSSFTAGVRIARRASRFASRKESPDRHRPARPLPREAVAQTVWRGQASHKWRVRHIGVGRESVSSASSDFVSHRGPPEGVCATASRETTSAHVAASCGTGGQAWIHRARESRKGASSGSALPKALPDRFDAPPKPVQTCRFAGHFHWS